MDENFSAVIQAHTSFVSQLREQISLGIKPTVDIPRVRRDDLCVLGRWLCDLQAEYGSMPEFQKLKAVHASFHSEAAHVLEQHAEGNDFDTLMRLNELTLVGGKSSQIMSACYDFLTAVEQSGGDPEKYKLPFPSDPDMGTSQS
jgi:hypothetical protein